MENVNLMDDSTFKEVMIETSQEGKRLVEFI